MHCKTLLLPDADTIGLSSPKNGPSSGLDCEDQCEIFHRNIRFKDEIELSFVPKVKMICPDCMAKNFEQNEDNRC